MKPNILFIFADQMRADCMGCAGNPVIRTPNLDRIAAAGMHFSNAYTPCPVCVPARATVTTGNYPHKCTGMKSNSGRILEDQLKIAELFSGNGYISYATGKLHYSPYSAPGQPRLLHGFDYVSLAESGRILSAFDPTGTKRGLEDYHDYLKDVGWGGFDRAHGIGNNDIHPAASPLPQEHCVDSWVCDRTIDYLDGHLKNNKEKPFFMFMSFPKPHAPYDPPVPYNTMYNPLNIPKPLKQKDSLPRSPEKIRESVTHGWGLFSPEMHLVTKAHYYGLISFQDRQIGRILDYLEHNNLDKNTIVVYSADHGDMIGDFGFFAKSCFYNGSVQVPFLMKYPGEIPSGGKSDELVGLQDILPTLASLAGIQLDRKVDGIDLSQLIKGRANRIRDCYVSYYENSPYQSYMIADRKCKYIYSELNGTREFYDLQNDPDELDNRINNPDYAQSVAEMERKLISWAIENQEHQILDGDRLKISRQSILEGFDFDKSTMGWRWY